jgi:hypothetical protein
MVLDIAALRMSCHADNKNVALACRILEDINVTNVQPRHAQNINAISVEIFSEILTFLGPCIVRIFLYIYIYIYIYILESFLKSWNGKDKQHGRNKKYTQEFVRKPHGYRLQETCKRG